MWLAWTRVEVFSCNSRASRHHIGALRTPSGCLGQTWSCIGASGIHVGVLLGGVLGHWGHTGALLGHSGQRARHLWAFCGHIGRSGRLWKPYRIDIRTFLEQFFESEKDHRTHDRCAVRSSVSAARWRPPGPCYTHIGAILGLLRLLRSSWLVLVVGKRSTCFLGPPELGHAPRADTKDGRGTKKVSRQSHKGFAALRPQGAIRCGRAPRRREGQTEGT